MAAAVAVASSVTPLYEAFVLGDIEFHHANLWIVAADAQDTAGWPAGVAVIQLLLVLAWTGCCTAVAVHDTATVLLPIPIAVLSFAGSVSLLVASDLDHQRRDAAAPAQHWWYSGFSSRSPLECTRSTS